MAVSPEIEKLHIQADERRIKQVMLNLLANAAKFTPDGGRIEVSARKNGQGLVISVSDTGIGIAPEHHKKIFDRFYQVQSGMRDKTPGAGLGLNLSRQIVEMHGGRMWVESEGIGQGSCFSFRIAAAGGGCLIGRRGLPSITGGYTPASGQTFREPSQGCDSSNSTRVVSR